jgi:hypothetical protein
VPDINDQLWYVMPVTSNHDLNWQKVNNLFQEK